jgi:hypothetical protein
MEETKAHGINAAAGRSISMIRQHAPPMQYKIASTQRSGSHLHPSSYTGNQHPRRNPSIRRR